MEQLIKMMLEQEENPEWGTLVLQIYCTKCEAIFEINPQAIAMAMATGASIWDYINYIQKSPCSNCKQKIDEKNNKVYQ